MQGEATDKQGAEANTQKLETTVQEHEANIQKLKTTVQKLETTVQELETTVQEQEANIQKLKVLETCLIGLATTFKERFYPDTPFNHHSHTPDDNVRKESNPKTLADLLHLVELFAEADRAPQGPSWRGL